MFCIGAGLGTLSQRFIKKTWLAAHASAAAGTAVWVGGFYVYLWAAAPGELGAPEIFAILFTYILMFIAAVVAIQAANARAAYKNPIGTALPKESDDGE